MTQTWERHIAEQDATEEGAALHREMLEALISWGWGRAFPIWRDDLTEGSIAKRVYKDTSCGAWVTFNREWPVGVRLGSIVEGSEATARTQTLEWPFTIDQWDNAIEAIEDDVDAIIAEDGEDKEWEENGRYERLPI